MNRLVFLIITFSSLCSAIQAQQRPDLWLKENIIRGKNLEGYSQAAGQLRRYSIDSILAQGFGIYEEPVLLVSKKDNPYYLRNRIVTDYRGWVYAVDYYGNSKALIDSTKLSASGGSQTLYLSGLNLGITNGNIVILPFVDTVSNQSIGGKKRFKDTLTADKGIVSNGLIDTKGVKSTGSATTAAATMNGVIAEKDTIVSTNFTLTGSYGSVGFDCTSGVKDCTLPNTTGTTDWVFAIRKEDNTTNTLRIKDSTGTVIYTLYSKISITFKNKSGTWKRLK